MSIPLAHPEMPQKWRELGVGKGIEGSDPGIEHVQPMDEALERIDPFPPDPFSGPEGRVLR